jgi:hypothetical protein
VSSDCERLGLAGDCVEGLCEPPADCVGANCPAGAPTRMPAPPPAREEPVCAPNACGGPTSPESCWKGACVSRELIAPYVCSGAAPARTEWVPFTTRVAELGTRLPPKGLVVYACANDDTDCRDPELRFVDQEGMGNVVLQLPYEFRGFLEFRSERTLTSRYYVNRPLVAPTEAQEILLITPDLSTPAQLGGTPIDLQSQGLVAVQMHDCSGASMGGIRFEIDAASAVPFFFVDGQPSQLASLSVVDPRSQLALGGFVNVPPGFTRVRARLGANGPILAQYELNVRANTIAQLELHP